MGPSDARYIAVSSGYQLALRADGTFSLSTTGDVEYAASGDYTRAYGFRVSRFGKRAARIRRNDSATWASSFEGIQPTLSRRLSTPFRSYQCDRWSGPNEANELNWLNLGAVGADAFDPYTALAGRLSIDPPSQTSTFGDVFTIASKALERPANRLNMAACEPMTPVVQAEA